LKLEIIRLIDFQRHTVSLSFFSASWKWKTH